MSSPDEQERRDRVVVPFPTQDQVLDAELVDEPGPHHGEQVNPPGQVKTAPWVTGIELQPVLPGWIRDANTRRHAVRYAEQVSKHWVLWHGARIPVYCYRVLVYSARGIGVTVSALYVWCTDGTSKPLQRILVERGDVEGFERNRETRRALVKRRRKLTAIGGVVALLSSVIVLAMANWITLLMVCAALGVLAKLGQPKDKPIVMGHAVVTAQVPRLTDAIVLKGLEACGINPKGVTFTAPIQRDGPGWRAEVELPHKNVAGEVVAKRENLAGGLKRLLGCVWPEPLPGGHPGQLVIWVGDRDLRKAEQEPWPLLKSGKVDLFQPVKWATDQRGRWIEITLMFTSGVIGSIPRVGKTVALRELLLIAALDPRCRIYAFDLKGLGDFSPLKPVSYAFAEGDRTSAIEYMVTSLRALQEDMRRRADTIAQLPRKLCPEFKVTSQLADMRHLGLFPVFLGIDECQIAFEHPVHGAEIEEIVTDIAKRGPASGIITYLATQRPDAKSIPPAISSNLAVRFCLKVKTQIANDMVLGTGANAAGNSALKFSFDDKGIGLLDMGQAPVIARTVTAIADAETSDRIAQRARQLREDAGTLEGYCLGEQPDAGPTHDVLDDVLTVFATAERLWSETIAERLAELRPGVYAGWGARELGSALRRPYGLVAADTWIDGANRKGFSRDQITVAVETHRRREINPKGERS